jgi:hypothetical protein
MSGGSFTQYEVTIVSKRKPQTGKRKPSARRARKDGLRPSLFPTQHGLEEMYARLREPCGIEGFFVGRKSKGTRFGRDLAVVCCVTRKARRLKDLPADACIPPALGWQRTRTGETTLPTDVVEIREATFQQLAPTCGPGDVLAAAGQPAESAHATIGIVLQHPEFGLVVTTAGHAFLRGGQGSVVFDDGAEGLQIFNAGAGVSPAMFKVRPRKAVINSAADYALLQPIDTGVTPRNLFEDVFNLSEPQLARPEDVGKKLFALTRRGRLDTTLLGVAGDLALDGVRMQGLLFTERVTVGGDSGCCLVDNTFRVWGLLVGAATVAIVSRTTGEERLVLCSIFAPANFVLAMEKARLIS